MKKTRLFLTLFFNSFFILLSSFSTVLANAIKNTESKTNESAITVVSSSEVVGRNNSSMKESNIKNNISLKPDRNLNKEKPSYHDNKIIDIRPANSNQIKVDNYGPYNWYASLNLSAYIMDIGRNQSVQLLENGSSNRYIAAKKSRLVPEIGIGAGGTFPLRNQFLLNVGLGLYYTGTIKDSGLVYQLEDPTLDRLSYYYNISSKRIMAEAKLYKKFIDNILPYISIGFGTAINHAYGYKETSIDNPATSPMKPFSNNTIIQFAYQFGLGVDFVINKEFNVGIGWQYVDMGKAELGLSPSQNVNHKFSTNDISTHSMNIHITYNK